MINAIKRWLFAKKLMTCVTINDITMFYRTSYCDTCKKATQHISYVDSEVPENSIDFDKCTVCKAVTDTRY